MKPFAQDNEISQHQQAVLRRKVYVKGLPLDCTQATLISNFSVFGTIDKAFILYNHKSGSSRGFGFVEFQLEESVQKALQGLVIIGGKEITVSTALERHKGVDKLYNRKNLIPKH